MRRLAKILLQRIWDHLFGSQSPERGSPPDEVLREVAAMREPGAHRFAFRLSIAHLPGGSRQSARIRIWDGPEWRGSVLVSEKCRDREGSATETVLRDGELQPGEVAGLRDALEKYGARALKDEPFRVYDGSPASLYVVERGVDAIPSGSMNLSHVSDDPVFDPATHAFFLAVLGAATAEKSADTMDRPRGSRTTVA